MIEVLMPGSAFAALRSGGGSINSFGTAGLGSGQRPGTPTANPTLVLATGNMF